MTLESLFDALHRAGHVPSATVPGIELERNHSPWYTRVLLGGMGWLGGLLVLGFFGALVSGLFNNAAGLGVLAIIMFGASVMIYRAAPNNDFATQFALAASICGQAAAAGSFGTAIGHGVDNSTVAWFIALMQMLLVFLMPNFLHRLLSTIFAVAALFFASKGGAMSVAVDLAMALGFVALIQFESLLVEKGQRAVAEPVLNGLAIGLLVTGIGYMSFIGGSSWFPHVGMSAIAFGIALLVWVFLASANLSSVSRGAALAGTVAFVAVSWRAPGLIASALVLLASFAAGRRTLTGLGLLAMVAYLSAYYYQMSLTLLGKSGVLALTGAVLLVLWWVHRQFFSTEAA
jgi:Domain of unknown function (DUF4401)